MPFTKRQSDQFFCLCFSPLSTVTKQGILLQLLCCSRNADGLVFVKDFLCTPISIWTSLKIMWNQETCGKALQRKANFAMIVQLARFGSGRTEIDFPLDSHLSKFRWETTTEVGNSWNGQINNKSLNLHCLLFSWNWIRKNWGFYILQNIVKIECYKNTFTPHPHPPDKIKMVNLSLPCWKCGGKVGIESV